MVSEVISRPDSTTNAGPWSVPSDSTPGVVYLISIDRQAGTFTCGCKDHQHRNRDCRHIRRVQVEIGLRPAAELPVAGVPVATRRPAKTWTLVAPAPMSVRPVRPHYHAIDAAARFIYSTHDDRAEAERAVARIQRSEDCGAFVGECPPSRCQWETAVRA